MKETKHSVNNCHCLEQKCQKKRRKKKWSILLKDMSSLTLEMVESYWSWMPLLLIVFAICSSWICNLMWSQESVIHIWMMLLLTKGLFFVKGPRGALVPGETPLGSLMWAITNKMIPPWPTFVGIWVNAGVMWCLIFLRLSLPVFVISAHNSPEACLSVLWKRELGSWWFFLLFFFHRNKCHTMFACWKRECLNTWNCCVNFSTIMP